MQVYKTLDNGIKIIEYEDSFAQSIADMWNQSQEEWGDEGSIRTASQIIDEHASSSNFNVYLAIDGTKVVGYCSFARYRYDANTLYIPLLNARPDYHGKGIGKALVLQCVERTIELGYPRLDLYTWSGNTAAVPLYKKCGFLWEDRSDSTHFVNFIPQILNTGLFADFFEKADWYQNSTRNLEVKPDGLKTNKFEVFGYTWENDGESLAIGFERSGRRMRMIETNDYKIEFMAESHSLAFGLDYDCTFKIKNKSGKDLHVKIKGQEDANIKFDYSFDDEITDSKELSAKFHVGSIDEPLDEWLIHPCLLAELEINGQSVTFGLGIETKFPITLNISDDCLVKQKGLEVDCYIDIESALLQDAIISFKVPKNNLQAFYQITYEVELKAEGKTSIPTKATILDTGFEAIPLQYKITLKDGREVVFDKPLPYSIQDFSRAYAYENDTEYVLVNGPWKLAFNKSFNDASVSHIANNSYEDCSFNAPKLGKPYNDEFNLMKPAVKMYQLNGEMIMETEFVSQKFEGMVLTQIFCMTASGVFSRRQRLENRGKAAKNMMINDDCWMGFGRASTFSYKGQITQNHNRPGLERLFDVTPDHFENWIFEADSNGTKGVYWSPAYKPSIAYGGRLTFDIDAGTLEPGQVFESDPIIYMAGMFTNYNDFRNYALKQFETAPKRPVDVLELHTNDGNPFVQKPSIEIKLANNRSTTLAGDISVSSSLFDTQTQTNEADALIEHNTFDVKLKDTKSEIGLIKLNANLVGFDKTFNRALFFPSGKVDCKQDGTVYSVSNGRINFKADPNYGPICYSLESQGYEWLKSNYPQHKPFAWWNPFFGGILPAISGMNNSNVLQESTKVDFAEVKDCHGNIWTGLRLNFDITEHEKLKGAKFEYYHLTLPELPILCTFFRFINETGVYKKLTSEGYMENGTEVFLNAADKLTDVCVELEEPDIGHHKLKAEIESRDSAFDKLLKISSTRDQNLYIYYNGENFVEVASKFLAVVLNEDIAVAAGKIHTSKPIFFVLTDMDLPQGALDDFRDINFDDKNS